MQITILYRNKTKRIVNVAPEFMSNSKVFEKGKQVVKTPQQKAKELAEYLDQRPYYMEMSEEGKVYHSHKWN